MKNIHILPTDKLSILGYDGVKNLHLTNMFIDDYVNIYITSDEEIKEGDYFIAYSVTIDKKPYISCASEYKERKKEKGKIILTTDQDLIKGGVQAIDDEFLEWFVKNPNCEEIKINYEIYKEGVGLLTSDWRMSEDDKYKIIIPKEESELKCDFCKRYPRLEGTNKCESCYSVVRHFLEQDQRFKDKLLPDLRKKQETFEEFTENYLNKFYSNYAFKDLLKPLLIDGAKWQAERMYSEEDMWEAYKASNTIFEDEVALKQEFKEWFEQFKKK